MASEIAICVALQLEARNLKVVLAESCTGGKTAALLTEVPGISRYFCGSAVTYREHTKRQWLNVDPEILHQYTAESQETSDAMATATLALTSEADFACAITGHLGPGVDSMLDGWVYVSIARRVQSLATTHSLRPTGITISSQSQTCLTEASRQAKQLEAALFMLQQISSFIKQLPAEFPDKNLLD